MSRRRSASETTRRAKALRDQALERAELRAGEGVERVPAAGPTSMALKARSATDDHLIEAWMRQRQGDNRGTT